MAQGLQRCRRGGAWSLDSGEGPQPRPQHPRLVQIQVPEPMALVVLGICIFTWLRSGGGTAGPSRAPGSSGRRLPSGPRLGWDR